MNSTKHRVNAIAASGHSPAARPLATRAQTGPSLSPALDLLMAPDDGTRLLRSGRAIPAEARIWARVQRRIGAPRRMRCPLAGWLRRRQRRCSQ